MSAIAATSLNGVKIYNLASGKTLPQWLSQRKKRSLAKDEDYRKRVELVQDFEFHGSSQRIKMSQDGNYIVATGMYPPTVKVYDVRELSIKFERRLDAEVLQFQILSPDYGKLVFLQTNRTLSFHAPYGSHYDIRVPKFGRDIAYNKEDCDLYVAASGSDIYRLNLDQGRFLAPFESQCPAVNVIKRNSMHGMVAAAGSNGILECWDPRTRSNIGSLDIISSISKENGSILQQNDIELTSLEFHSDGLTYAVGTSNGYCSLYDLRSSKPLLTKYHQYGEAIHTLRFHQTSQNILSADSKVVKIWNQHTGKIFTNIETPSPNNDVCVVQTNQCDSGVLLIAGEQQRVMSYYIPELGYAPKWCSFLDSLTEELEENASTTVYDDYKFLTKQEMIKLGLDHLIGTSLVKAYMHGFFMDSRLYERIRSVSEPFAYDIWRKEKIQSKISEKQASRINIQRRLPKINRDYAEKLLDSTNNKKLKQKEKKPLQDEQYINPLGDQRFSQMFTSTDFEIDQESEDYRRLHPNAQNTKKKQEMEDMDSDQDEDKLDDRFDLVSEEEKEGKYSDESTSEEDNDDDNDDDDDDKNEYNQKDEKIIKSKDLNNSRRRPRFYEIGNDEKLTDLVGFGTKKDQIIQQTKREIRKLPLSQRLQQVEEQEKEESEIKLSENGEIIREMSFIPLKDQDNEMNLNNQIKSKQHKKRGIQDLKLKKLWNGKRKK